MPDYDFKNISPYDFENLVRDLIQKELNITLECFTVGRDEGIDLRHSTNKETQTIIQCKHYAGTGFGKLYSNLKLEELVKVKKIAPKYYILATSIGLTPHNKKEIMKLFSPYISSEKDICGRDDLNNLLGKYPDIEKQHFKLWLTSQAVLDRILHSGVYNQTEIEIDNIRQKIKYYVRNRTFAESKEILEKKHYCIIAGIPGIGKTMLAELLSIEYLSNGYELIKIFGDISEAFEVFNLNRNQIFFYDDFLGQTSLENKFGKNEEQKLIMFIEIIIRSPNKRLILTTREYILNKAKGIYEKLNHVNYFTGEYLIHLVDYTELQKAEILFNHLYFSDLSSEYRDIIIRNKNYLKIIHHPNFNPRIIETMINNASKFGINSSNYLEEFLANLENPRKIWDHAFEYQLSESSRILLIVLISLPYETFIEDLEQTFNNLYKYKSINYGLRREDHAFRKSLKELEGSFIEFDRSKYRITVMFKNPSIRDFMQNHLKENRLLFEDLLNSITFFDQCQNLLEFITPKYLGKLLDCMSSTFKYKDCCVMHVDEIGGTPEENREYKEEAVVSLESRIVFTISVWNKFNKSEIAFKLIQKMLLSYAEIIDELNGQIDPRPTYEMDTSELAEFIGVLSINEIPISKKLYELLEPYFLKGIDGLRNYKNAINFIKLDPDHNSHGALMNLKEEFENYYQYYLRELNPEYVFKYDSLIMPFEEEIDEHISLLKEIGDIFNIDISFGISKLEKIRVMLVERKIESTNNPDSAYETSRDEKATYNDNEEEINNIFSHLDKT